MVVRDRVRVRLGTKTRWDVGEDEEGCEKRGERTLQRQANRLQDQHHLHDQR